MPRTCIAIVDATRARLFMFDRTSNGGAIREELSERTDLVNPARRHTASALFSDTHPGSSRAGTRGFAFDDHRDAHVDQMDSEFARDIAVAIRRTLRETDSNRVILCASPRMLGALRATDLENGGVVIDELRRDLSKLTPPRIRELLVEHHLLPAMPPRPAFRRQA